MYEARHDRDHYLSLELPTALRDLGINVSHQESRGYAALRQLSLAPPQAMEDLTGVFLEKICKDLSAPLKAEFEAICSGFLPSFAAIERESGFTAAPDRAGTLAYALYQGGAEIDEALASSDPQLHQRLKNRVETFKDKHLRLAKFLFDRPWHEGLSLSSLIAQYWRTLEPFSDVAITQRPLGFPDAFYEPSWFDWGQGLFQTLQGTNPELQRPDVSVLQDLECTVDCVLGNHQDPACRLVSWNMLPDLPFFRKEHAITLDAGIPLLAIAEILCHEATHHLYHLVNAPAMQHSAEGALAWIHSPVLNEGFAEYHTGECLKAVFQIHPELAMLHYLRRIFQAQEDQNDAHLSGFSLLSGLATRMSVRDPVAVADECEALFNGYRNVMATPFLSLIWNAKNPLDSCSIEAIEFPDRDFLMEMLH
ncbi:hypothetical protein [Pseudovibrio sp. SPO723]|uniref:hypothetical protein n=1 Tax=Nesiotobacter zosterae TaxID=392721 RepID=UPI0029C1B530|nr:hypothetical protein [Pseudovibrio sp. SPO723]MDX5594564.1 hypothetical protein [Pseudovibrio sp. SPO723]